MVRSLVPLIFIAATANVQLIKGEFRDGKQMLTVKNTGPATIKRVHVNCGFFRDNVLVDTHGATFENLLPNQAGNNYTVTDATGVTSVDCRIDDVY
jgi:hypothetical protein